MPGSWDRSKNHNLYDPRSGDLVLLVFPDRWKVNGAEAARYVREHLVGSFQNDHPDVLFLYERTGKFVFMLVRSMMAYLTWTVWLFRSEGTEDANAEEFMRLYFPSEYHPYGKDIYRMYRHGLMHKGFPASDLVSARTDPTVGVWEIGSGYGTHLSVVDEEWTFGDDPSVRRKVLKLPINPRRLYEDLLCAMRRYADDLEGDEDLINRFVAGFRKKS